MINNYVSKELLKKRAKLKLKKYRDSENLFICEGYHLVLEALCKNIVLEIFLSSKFEKKINFPKIFLISESQLKKISSTNNPQGIIAICKKFEISSKDQKILFLNKISDPGNLGTLIRSALAFNFDSVVVEGVDLYNSKTIRASQGAFFHIKCTNILNAKSYLEDKENIYGALLDKNAKIYNQINYQKKLVLILGNEALGIDKNLYSLIDTKIYIPINFESLNIASAGAIIMSEIAKKTNN